MHHSGGRCPSVRRERGYPWRLETTEGTEWTRDAEGRGLTAVFPGVVEGERWMSWSRVRTYAVRVVDSAVAVLVMMLGRCEVVHALKQSPTLLRKVGWTCGRIPPADEETIRGWGHRKLASVKEERAVSWKGCTERVNCAEVRVPDEWELDVSSRILIPSGHGIVL